MNARIVFAAIALAVTGIGPGLANAGSAPKWMHALAEVPLPAHDEKTNAVLLYADVSVIIEPNGKIKRVERKAYKILRPDGAARGKLVFIIDGNTRITDLYAWCIPASGKDYEVKQRDAVESALSDVPNGMLVTDIRGLMLTVPAAEPGNIIGYEVTREETPYILAEQWIFQDTIPVREAHFNLQLPKGWSYRATWLNHAKIEPTSSGDGQWLWTLDDVTAVHQEARMPSLEGITGKMFVALIPPSGQGVSIQSWNELGAWYDGLSRGRRDLSPELKQKVAELTASAPNLLAKMQAVANFVQEDIRYVGIELGIGGYQPHPAAEVFNNRFGDCKDKATLLSAMLTEIGAKSYYVLINVARGAVTGDTPPSPFFNHVIVAVALPAGVDDPSLQAGLTDASLGRLLFFDPTNQLTPFGALSGALQGSFGLLVMSSGGELVELPHLPVSSNGITRSASLTLDEQGTLRGDVHETRLGMRASEQRFAVRAAKADTDQIKPVEELLAASMPTFQITKASISNLRAVDKPFEWRYSVEAEHYARAVGELLLVRPRVIGSKAQAFLETKERREQAIEFPEPERDTDLFEIALPPGYVVDELPASVDIDAGFASYHSKTEVVGRTLRYSRSYEVAQLSVPADKANELKALYRVIDADERSAVVLKQASR